MTDDPVDEAREREAAEAERLAEAKGQADETLERAEQLQREAEEQELPTPEAADTGER
jgi:hypothetical protein